MRIFVTGGSGSVGREVLKLLELRGHTLRVIGRSPSGPVEDYVRCDVTDYAALKGAMDGFDAVVHLAAIANPVFGPDEEIFRMNCAGTFNVYQAASEQGIRRVVSASSINALGFNFGVRAFSLRYLPVDEDHPTFTTDPYSFSKQVLEEIAAYFWRREGISGCCLRLPWVANATEQNLARMRRDLIPGARRLGEWIELPPEEGARKAAGVMALSRKVRDERLWEYPSRFEAVASLPDSAIMSSYTNLFTQVDARDSAQAFEKALTARYEGSHPLFINDRVNRYLLDSRALARLFYPDAEIREGVSGCSTLVSTRKAADLIGYEPRYTMDRLGVHEAPA